MREEALILSEEVFKTMAPVSGDLDWNYIWPHIQATQDKWIQPALGQSLYEKIMTDIAGGSLSGDYKTLVDDYIVRVTVWFTCYGGLPFWGVKVVNSGIMQRIVDDGQAVSFTDIDKLAELCRGQGEFYKERLINYLRANSSKFTEFTKTVSGEMGADGTNYSGGLNLERYT